MPKFNMKRLLEKLKELELSHETPKGADSTGTEPMRIQSPPDMPPPPVGSSTGEAQIETYLGVPGDDYPATWGISVSYRKVPRV